MNTKRILALILCAVMVLSLIPVAVFTASAAEVEGMWTTYRFAGEYPDPDEEPDPDAEPPIYKPEAGYTYTSEGFSIVPADYKDTTPALSVVSKEKQPVKDGIYLQFRIDDYSYDGGTGADQWICLSLTTGEKVGPGSTAYGGGWLTLVRGAGNGACTTLPHLTDPKTEEFGGSFNNIGSIGAEAPMDDEGREIYTFEVTHNGTEYEMKINGVVQPGAAQASALLDKLDANGEFYVGINIQAGVKDGTAALTILKYGTSEADATTPVGSDSKEPEENQMTIAPIADASTVEANQPAILWTPDTVNISGGNNCTFTVLGDNTWRVSGTDTAVFWQFSPKRSWSYAGEDFPIFGMLVRNFYVDGGNFWYAAGEVMSPQDGYNQPFSIWDGESYEAEDGTEYFFVPVDMTDLWEGRINSVRLDIAMSDPENREFDICFAGMFRSYEEGLVYAENYLKSTGIIPEDYTKAPETTEAPKTEAPDVPTDAPTTQAPTVTTEQTTEPAAKGGCGSVIGFGAAAVLVAAAAAVVLKKKD